MRRGWWVLGWVAFSLPVGAEPLLQEQGRLTDESPSISSGEFADLYDVDVRRGQAITVRLRSDEFDPYAIVILGDEVQLDEQGHNGTVQVAFVAPYDGRAEVVVTTGQPGERGAYELEVAERSLSGSLREGDQRLQTGELQQVMPLWLPARAAVTVTCSSEEFDPYLMVHSGTDKTEVNDTLGLGSTAQGVVRTREAGVVLLQVTSNAPGEQGAYSLAIQPGVHGSLMPYRLTGRLEEGDRKLGGGEWADHYSFVAEAGRSYTVEARSEVLAAYLMVVDPDGVTHKADAFDGAPNTRIRFTPRSAGLVQVLVSSAAAGETGEYELLVTGAEPASPTARPSRRLIASTDRAPWSLFAFLHRSLMGVV